MTPSQPAPTTRPTSSVSACLCVRWKAGLPSNTRQGRQGHTRKATHAHADPTLLIDIKLNALTHLF